MDGAISFSVPDYPSRKVFTVLILDEDDREILRLSNFAAIDERGTGELLIPITRMRVGDYRLIVSPTPEDSISHPREYRFKVR